MAKYASLSDSDKSVVQSTVQLIRAVAGSTARNYNAMRAIADDTNAIALIKTIDDSEMIPNESGLAGSDELTKKELVDLWSALDSMAKGNDNADNRARWAKAAGTPNTLGT